MMKMKIKVLSGHLVDKKVVKQMLDKKDGKWHKENRLLHQR